MAVCVAAAMRRAGLKAVLTGGACAALYSRGAYESSDLDFIMQSAVTENTLDTVMRSIGFRRDGGQYRHPSAQYFVEFPAGPLGIGSDLRIVPVVYRVGRGSILALSTTDSCRDRLAAFYHWNDRQSLAAAVAIARRRRVDLAAIRAWSEHEGALPAFETFRELVRRARAMKRRTRRVPRRPVGRIGR